MQLLKPQQWLLVHMIQIILFHMEIIQLNLCLMRDFNNTNVIKYNNANYDP